MEINVIQVTEQYNIKAPRKKVYNILLDVGKWWGEPYLINKDADKIILEPKIGGIFYEDWGNGHGFKWGEVVHLKENELLVITGTHTWTSAFYSKITFSLEEKDSGTTIIKVDHLAYGDIGEDTRLGYIKGWKALIGEKLKNCVEKS